MKIPFIKVAALVPLCMWLSLSCEISTGSSGGGGGGGEDTPANDQFVAAVNKSSAPYADPIQKLFASGEATSKTVSLSGLANHSVYLVKVNKGGSAVSAADTGALASYSASWENGGTETQQSAARLSAGYTADSDPLAGPVSGIFTDRDGQTVVRYEHPVRFDAALAELPNKSKASGLLLNETRLAVQYEVGAIKKFWVLNASENFTQIDATLQATRTHGNVWVANANFGSEGNQITLQQAQEMAEKFDQIYGKETALFGYEYGGGPGGNGGVDGDPKIQILVYDIFDDYTPTQNGGVFGYYYGADELDGAQSNKAEMFYIDAHFTDIAANAIYSTLAHEFQHMINLNVKGVERGLNAGEWYNEMLSMLAEDVIDPLIDIPASSGSHPINGRLPYFLGYYNYADPTVWLGGNDVYYSYANAYALGAYLVRNFGGAALIQQLMQNDSVDIGSITAALASPANPLRLEVGSFEAALSRYGEALLYNQTETARPAGALSFNNTVTHPISGTDYTFTGFDVGRITNPRTRSFGPTVWDAGAAYDIPARTVQLQSKDDWQDKSGSLTINVQRPASPNIEVYIMVR